jgi:hypothetical protein
MSKIKYKYFLPVSERASDSQLTRQFHPPNGPRYQPEPLSVFQLVYRGLHWRPSVRLPTRRGLHATFPPKINTEIVVKEGREWPWKGSVSVSFNRSTMRRSRREIIRWYESDMPWGHLNEEGETEPEGIDECSDEDDDKDD